MSNKNFTNKYKSNFTPMTPKKDGTKKTVAFWVLFVLIILWTVGSIFGTLSFFNVKLNSNTYTAKADEVQDVGIYDGNNFFVSTSSWNRSGTQNFTSPYLLSVDIKLVLEDYWVANPNVTLFAPKLYIRSVMDNRKKPLVAYEQSTSMLGNVSSSGEFSVLNANYLDYNNTSTPLPSLDTVVSANFWLGYEDYATSGYAGYYGFVSISYPLDFNCNVTAVRYYSMTEVDDNNNNQYGIIRRYVVNYIDYIDSNGKVFTLGFYSIYNNSSVYTGDVSWEDRIYYLTNAFTDNQNYQNGYEYGYQQGKNDYTNSGYQDGLKNGYNQGYNQGKTDGIASANDYTFLGLFSALIDAPIQALSGLFNFNVMGINMFSLVSGLFTLFVVLIIVRLILGGGIGG